MIRTYRLSPSLSLRFFAPVTAQWLSGVLSGLFTLWPCYLNFKPIILSNSSDLLHLIISFFWTNRWPLYAQANNDNRYYIINPETCLTLSDGLISGSSYHFLINQLPQKNCFFQKWPKVTRKLLSHFVFHSWVSLGKQKFGGHPYLQFTCK